MKKSFFAIPIILAASACSASPLTAKEMKVPDIPFGATAEISYGGIDCKAQIKRLQSGEWEFLITEPYSLEGLTMKVTDGKTKLEMFGEESGADKGSDAVSMARAVAAAYDAASVSPAPATVGDNGCTLTGTSELGAYTFELDKSGIPTHLSADCGSLTVFIAGFSELPPDIEAEIVE